MCRYIGQRVITGAWHRAVCYPTFQSRVAHSTSMTARPLDLTLELAPKARFDVVDLRAQFAQEHAALGPFRRCLYWSFHTTAGFLGRSLASRLSPEQIPG